MCHLPRPDVYYDQAAVLGTLLLLDGRLGAGQAARFLTPGGLWQQWIDGPPSKDYDAPDSYREFIGQLCDLADESARHCTAQRR
ncbi:DUF6000 family protein [Streptomyces sp. NPDC059474]|uniref:DUF6000 family protein n=1 Tax=Streptomyces sp. NPDC059474 TaxID=3346846 RepID=UPI0036AA8DFF